MTMHKLYEALYKAGIDFKLIEIEEGALLLRFLIDDYEIKKEKNNDKFTKNND
jgi:hypothetical protein